jgi:hypothetical protein
MLNAERALQWLRKAKRDPARDGRPPAAIQEFFRVD